VPEVFARVLIRWVIVIVIAVVLANCDGQSQDVAPSSTARVETAPTTTALQRAECSEPRATDVTERFLRAFNTGDFLAVEALLAKEPRFEFVSTALAGPVYDRPAAIRNLEALRAAGEVVSQPSFEPVPSNSREIGVQVSYGSTGRVKVVVDCLTDAIFALSWDFQGRK
jgi:hypothetical protein